ncbi:hypothetical protein IFM61606_09908 [Aspergillus udagawae]|nr:hypothetical protein IFM61606_09908 [Aspergillus udagawae]
MAEGPQLLNVTTIANDEEKLLEAARNGVNKWKELENSGSPVKVALDKDWIICNEGGKDLGTADLSIRALLVTQKGQWGAVRVDSDPITNVVTGNGNELYIVFIEPGQMLDQSFARPKRQFNLRASAIDV